VLLDSGPPGFSGQASAKAFLILAHAAVCAIGPACIKKAFHLRIIGFEQSMGGENS
jgi:hypothetical protein